MPQEFTIRLATPDDMNTLVNHRRWMFEDMAQARGEHIDPTALDAMDHAYRPYLEKRFADGSFYAWVAEVEGQVIASAALTVFPDYIPHYSNPSGVLPYLHDVYTRHQYRHQGLARRLVQQALAYCQARGYPSIRLHASPEGRPLYEKLGFRPSNEMRLNF